MKRFLQLRILSPTSVLMKLCGACVVATQFTSDLAAHQITFHSSMTYSDTQPAGGADSVGNWTGAAFDADNIGGTGINANGSPNNGPANDDYTYVANNRPVQGQSFLTGSAANGYQLNAITVRMTGYTNNVASGGNVGGWNLHEQNGPIILTICEITGTNRTVQTMQNFKAGDVGNPGSGSSANGPGDYITFHLPFTTYLKPNTTYGFELQIGNGGANYFEWHGTRNDPYTAGTAYSREWWGGPLTPLAGDRVFQVDMTTLALPEPTFTHPGTLHTQADLDRMKAKVQASEQPWLSGYNTLLSSPYNNLGWPAYNVDYIVRGGSGNNYTRSQQDAQLIYTLTLIWHLTGDTRYADRAVYIANTWSDLIGLQGDSNVSLAAGICGYLFASAGELLSTYPGWGEADKQAYKDMMMRVFYPANFDFLWRQHDTFWRNGGNTHYRLNWATANMASMAAIGILCDNRAVYEQALDFFKYGPNNGRVERAAWYVHPGGLGQGEEAGRDQGHNLGGWHAMALLCQMAWNQGDDLFGYDNNRVLRVFEYNAKFNLWHDVPYARHQTCDLGYSEGSVSWNGRGIGQYYQYELVYNHYANVKGIAASWSKLAAEATRPEPWPNTGVHPSQVDWFGLGTLTYSQDEVTTDQPPTGLRANWSKHQIILDWWGSARATNYLVKRAATVVGPYTQIGTVTGPDMDFADTNVVNGTTYFYLVTAQTPSGDLDSDPLRVAQELVTHYTFEGNADDVAGTQNATLHGGSTGLPGYSAGFGGGQAIDLDGVDDYVQLPVGAANFQDITVAAWVRWDGGGNWQRVFDFGSEIEKTMFLATKNGSGVIEWGFTTTRGGNVVGDASYYLTGPAMPVGVWTHVAVTLKGDIMTLYVNGVPVDTRFNDLIDPLYGQPFCYIGKSMYNADTLFNGRIDDFRIYNYGLSGAEVYSLWGQSTNSAPEFSADPIDLPVATEDTPYTGQSLADFASDVNGGSLTFSKVNGPSWLNIAANGLLYGTPRNGDVGENLFVVGVRDSMGATDDATLRLNVTNVNDPPIWTANPIDGGTNLQGTAYSFSVADDVSDVDAGDALTISKVDGPAWLTVAADGSISGTPGGGDVGTNAFTLRASDLAGAYNDATFTVVVAAGTTIAYWNFEEGTPDSYVPYSPGSSGQYDGSILDVSLSGNNLSAWSSSWEWYRTNVPATTTPQNGAPNTLSVQGANSFPAMSAIGTSLTTWNPHQWTIEAAFNVTAASGNQTVVGRDSYGAYSGNAALSALYLGTRGSSVAVQFTDSAGNNWNLVSPSGVLEANQWQAIAAVSDGSTLSLYLKNVTAGEPNYTLMGMLNISSSTNSALSVGAGDGGEWDAGVFSVGRGLYSGGHTDRVFGYIDDVRFSTVALSPNQFLYSAPASPSAPTGLAAVGSDSQVLLSWNVVDGATNYVIKRSLISSGPYDFQTNSIATTYSDLGLLNGTNYFYVVSAVGGGGESADSEEVSARPISSVPPQIGFTNNGNNLELTWSADHTGWRLEAQTNAPGEGIGTNWFPVYDSETTNQFSIPLNTSRGSVFHRLVHP